MCLPSYAEAVIRFARDRPFSPRPVFCANNRRIRGYDSTASKRSCILSRHCPVGLPSRSGHARRNLLPRQNRKIRPPRSSRLGVLNGHALRDLVDVVQVVCGPGDQQRAQRHGTEPRVRTAKIEPLGREIDRSSRSHLEAAVIFVPNIPGPRYNGLLCQYSRADLKTWTKDQRSGRGMRVLRAMGLACSPSWLL